MFLGDVVLFLFARDLALVLVLFVIVVVMAFVP